MHIIIKRIQISVLSSERAKRIVKYRLVVSHWIIFYFKVTPTFHLFKDTSIKVDTKSCQFVRNISKFHRFKSRVVYSKSLDTLHTCSASRVPVFDSSSSAIRVPFFQTAASSPLEFNCDWSPTVIEDSKWKPRRSRWQRQKDEPRLPCRSSGCFLSFFLSFSPMLRASPSRGSMVHEPAHRRHE